MKIIYTLHALQKFGELKLEGWIIKKNKIAIAIKNPKWKGKTRENQETALNLIDSKHIIRIVFERKKGGIIKVITFHLGKRGRYESTL